MIMKKLLVIFFAFLLIACARTAEDAYKEGKYMESIDLITQHIEGKGQSQVSKDDLDRFRQIVSNVSAHYEDNLLKADLTDYQKRIESYESLLNMRNKFNNQFYSQQVDFFNNKYSINELRQLIAKEYYLYGNSINATDGDSYLVKATLYRKGMEQYKYKDIDALYKKTNTKYMQVAANEYYQKGKELAEVESYKDAADYFSKAAAVYKPLGKYKDSENLSNLYNKKYRSSEAQEYYDEAKSIGEYAKTRREYRKMAALYEHAESVYGTYGSYRDASSLASKYKQKGMIKIYVPQSEYKSMIEKEVNADYVTFVSSQSASDIMIQVTNREKYEEEPQHSNTQAMSENIVDKTITTTNDQGVAETKDTYKTYYFNLKTTENSNSLVLMTSIKVTGIYNYANSFETKKESEVIQYEYSGNVPAKYKNYSSGKYLSQRKLSKKALEKQESLISSELSALSSTFSEL